MLTVICAVLALAGMAAADAKAATFTPTRSDDPAPGVCDPGDCSLREAIGAAKSDAGPDTIQLGAGTYRLTRSGNDSTNTNGDLDYVTMLGDQMGALELRGAGANQTTINATGPGDRILQIGAETDPVTISDLTLTGGGPPSDGMNGGAIHSESQVPLNLDHVVIASNTSFGGAGLNIDEVGTPQMTTVSNSTFSGNQAFAGAGIGASGSGSGEPHVEVVNSTFYGNTAVAGAAIESSGTFTMASVTVTQNTDNGDPAVRNDIGGTFFAHDSVVAGNLESAGGPNADCGGTFADQGGNVIGTFAPPCVGFGPPADVAAADPRLDPLADNGGPTPTVALLSGSPAIDFGSGCPATDQRGSPRGGLSGPCDSGAYELPPNAFSFSVKGKRLIVSVHAPGKVSVADAASPLSASAAKKRKPLLLGPSSASGGPPTITVRLSLTKAAKSKLKKGKVTVNARITFTPQGGLADSRTGKLKIKGRRRKK